MVKDFHVLILMSTLSDMLDTPSYVSLYMSEGHILRKPHELLQLSDATVNVTKLTKWHYLYQINHLNSSYSDCLEKFCQKMK